jgi:RNA polymerase sigma factor (sigma-70 family)
MPATLAQVVRRCLDELTEPCTDARLVREFQVNRSPDAFTELVARHGPVVLGVAHRVLGRSPDVDDVFQATFLTLARKIHVVRDPSRLAGWLHRVALRTAHRALVRRRTMLPIETASLVAMRPEDHDLSWREGLQILDAELNALPDRLRSPLVLCYLDGLTRDEAARRLGYSLAKLKRRLEEGRARLRERLSRRGVVAALLVVVAGSELRGNVSKALVAQTAALPFGPVAATVVSLTSSVGGRALAAVVWKSVIVVGLLSGVLATGFRFPVGAQSPMKDEPVRTKVESTPTFEAPLPTSALVRLGTTRFRHNNGSNSSILSNDGKLLVTTGKTTIAIWDTATGQQKHLLRKCGIADGFTTASKRVALSPDGSLLANFSQFDAAVRVWDTATGKQVYTIGKMPAELKMGGGAQPARVQDEGFENILTFDESGQELLLVGGNGARRFEAKSGKPLGKHPWKADPLAVSPNGRWCLTNANPNGQRAFSIVDLTTGKAGPIVAAGEGPINGNVDVTLDGKRIAIIGRDDATVVVYEVTTGKSLTTFEDTTPAGRERGFTVAAFSADAKMLFVGTRSGHIRRYNLETKKELSALAKHLWYATGVHPMPDGKTLISAGWDGLVRKFDLGTGKEIPPPPGYVRHLALASSNGGKQFALADSVGRFDVCDADGKTLRTIDTRGAAISKVAFSPNGTTLACVEVDGAIRTWDWATGREGTGVTSATPGVQSRASVLQYSPNGRQLLVGLRESNLLCLDAATKKEVWSVATKGMSAASFSPDGRILVTGGWDHNLTWRDPATGQPGRVVTMSTVVDCVEFAPDGRTFVSAHHDGIIRLWDAETGKPLGEWQGHNDCVWWARFSPDGKWVASGSVDETVRVWEVATGKELAKYEGHDAWVWAGAWLGGRRLVTSTGAEAIIWDLRPTDLPAAKADRLWDDLMADPVKAYKAQWAYLADAKEAAKEFRSRQGPVKARAEEKEIQKLIGDLDRDEFRVREQATKDLRKIGRSVLPYLRSARATAKAEPRQRIDGLIAALDQGPTAEDRRLSRAVQVLELAGTPEAKAVFKEWASGLRGELLTEDAANALQRLERQ